MLPHTIAYAANDRMVYLPYDGILGLGIMRWAYYACSLRSTDSSANPFRMSPSFTMPIRRAPTSRPWAMPTYYSILQPSRFTVGLRHPAHTNNSGLIADGTPYVVFRISTLCVIPLNDPRTSRLRDPFIIFGPEFPGQVTVEWTPRIYVWQQGPNPDTKWRLYMESMTLLVPKAGVDIKYDSEDGYEALTIQTNIPLVLDICQAQLTRSRRSSTDSLQVHRFQRLVISG